MDVDNKTLVSELIGYLPPPNTYSSFIGTLLLLVAIVFLSIALWEKQRGHATKIFSILLVASIAFFSAHWSTYFAAIFIVATAVTELEFLQNLAAIIRKDENYFNFKKEALSREENIKRKAGEVIEDGFALDSAKGSEKYTANTRIDLSSLREISGSQMIKLSIGIEERALDFISKTHGKIERGVRFRKDGNSVEFDGLIPSRDNKSNKVYEVKWVKNKAHFFPFLSFSLKRCADISRQHEAITGYKPEINLVVVVNTSSEISSERKIKIEARAKGEGVNIIYLCLEELGYEVVGSSV